MDPLAPLRTAWSVPGAVVRTAGRALDDLNSVAERARRDPDPVEEVRERADLLLAEAAELIAEVRALVPTAVAIETVARELTAAATVLTAVAAEIVEGGRDLTVTGRSLDGHTVALIDGGADLTAVARSLDRSLLVFRQALPRVLEGIDTVEELEQAAETVAETVEPLAGVADRVGRVSDRLSRRRGRRGEG